MKTTREYFDEKVDKTPGHGPNGDCWLWTACKNKKGYGRFRFSGRSRLAHRVAYQFHSGEPIPDGLCVLHSCDNPPCVNHDHLSLGTDQDNSDQKWERGRAKPVSGDRNGSRTHPESRPRGEDNGRAKITADQVREIRARYADANVSHRTLARMYGVDRTQIGKIINRQKWRHVV